MKSGDLLFPFVCCKLFSFVHRLPNDDGNISVKTDAWRRL